MSRNTALPTRPSRASDAIPDAPYGPAPQGPLLMTFKEAMDYLRVSRSTIYRLMWAGQLRGHKVGSSWRFYEADLLAAVATPTFTPADDRVPAGEGGRP